MVYNQRALYNHALSIVVGVGIVCTHRPPGTGLDIETSYFVHTCTSVPHIKSDPLNSYYLNLSFSLNFLGKFENFETITIDTNVKLTF